MRLIAYEAILADPRHLAQVQSARQAVEAVGGRLLIEPPTKAGMRVVTLHLPEGYAPKQFLPGLPFYPT